MIQFDPCNITLCDFSTNNFLHCLDNSTVLRNIINIFLQLFALLRLSCLSFSISDIFNHHLGSNSIYTHIPDSSSFTSHPSLSFHITLSPCQAMQFLNIFFSLLRIYMSHSHMHKLNIKSSEPRFGNSSS